MTNEKETDTIPFPDEIAHLAALRCRLDDALREADDTVERIDRDYMSEKRYMAQYRGEIDPHEMFQNELALRQIDRTGAFAVSVRGQIAKLQDSPYFARVDFQPHGSKAAFPYYIGRFSFRHQDKLLVCDWRAPVAGLFYDCEIGPAGYDAPMGRMERVLTRKRQFKIKDGRMEYVIETSVNVQDDVLQRELSHTSDEKMKSIIATIQKEQNRIIRNEKAGTLLIQGAAGSGKTSIALHRIAYLLYRFKGRLSAQNVTIISPNRVFGDYISNVLPELGEEPIYELGLADIAAVQLESVIAFEPDRDPMETEDTAWMERARFKSTLSFLRAMDRFLETLPATVFEAADCAFGEYSVEAAWIQNRFAAYGSVPVKRRLELLASDLHDRFASGPFADDSVPTVKAILKRLRAMMKIKNTLGLYKAFYRWLGVPEQFVLPAKKTLEWADVYPFLYVHASFEGLRESRMIRHLVVDEMQDYAPVQFAVLNRLFPCQKTILGDFGQCIDPCHSHTLADLRQMYEGAEFVELNKSYRSTYEIIRFAKRIHPAAPEPIERHGEEPVLLPCAGKEEELERIKALIETFRHSGFTSLGILVKTGRGAEALHEKLSQGDAVHLLTPESRRFVNGVSVASIRMAKGLEFDAVVIPDADSETYATESDRSLLYVACTRAMHRLSLLYTGERSRLIGEAT
ncbi:3'-5' exonuclease [Clostridium sp. D33t1_170424_F3]|uniref:HelD family protein n=1 Tax=Clostridium sp. D33t1_170424_F3 TaxID=2787099 RepID=UPI0018AA44C3|nr:3'-5' exonuclease [Clostridium sp. D33t1_170424_F3]